VIALIAFVIKAMTGFGPAIIFISVGSLFLLPHDVIAASSILDLIAGLVLLRSDSSRGTSRFWLPLAAVIIVGAVAGSIFLDAIPPDPFRLLLGGVIVLLGVWFAIGRIRTGGNHLQTTLPPKPDITDSAITFSGGICGGLFGISGPPIIWHFGRRYAKLPFRQIIVPIFVAAALARVVTYSTLGLVNREVLTYVLAALPGLIAGIYLGNKIFFKLSEAKFSRIVGIVLVIAGIRLLMS
jgi:uncharacterized membrane protein YfcA